MTKDSFDLNEFRHSIYLDAALEEVYMFAASAAGICKWFMGTAVYTESDGRELGSNENASRGCSFSWKWLEKDLEIEGRVLEAAENKKFSFTFGKSFEVSFMLEDSGGRVLFTLHQKYAAGGEKNDFAHINCCTCWVFFLTNLKSVIENGIDLRETIVSDDTLVNR